MQTWVTHMKHPLVPGGLYGFSRIITLQLTLGITLITGLFHLPGIMMVMLIWIYAALSENGPSLPVILSASLLSCYVAGIIIGITGAVRLGRPKLIISTLGMPLYWLGLFGPTLKALVELKRRPFHWNKTEHGDKDAAT